GVAEVRQLHLDAIASAREYVFMENQYFSSNAIGDALTARLREPVGPEMLLVSARTESGWLEATTMGVLRARLYRRLVSADARKRFRTYCPELPDLAPQACLNVHSKVMVVDDALLTLGSANLSNRSLGFDTECNIAIESRGDPRLRAAIASLRDRLLGEHLGVAPGRVADALRAKRSLI